MAKLNKIEPIVKEILERYPEARKDDMYLYWMYIQNKIGSEHIEEVFFDDKFRKDNGISPYHSIARCRRRLQAKHEELKPSKEVQDARLNETAEYINYAIDGYESSFMKMVDSYE